MTTVNIIPYMGVYDSDNLKELPLHTVVGKRIAGIELYRTELFFGMEERTVDCVRLMLEDE